MFSAIFIPPMKKSPTVTAVVLISALLSCCFTFIPLLKSVSTGFVIIICAVTAAAIGAVIKPVEETEAAE